jgi:uncharacterized protein YceH (UPF0502 family)
MDDLDSVELRVLGCLIEKQRTTPDQYPLSLNALRLACNQSTNREPVVDYEEAQIREALHRLSGRGLTRLASGPSSRVAKYRHLFDEALSLDGAETAVLALLMLRGPQTMGELKGRSERLHRFSDLDDIARALGRLADRELAAEQSRRPGQKEERWAHLLGAAAVEPPAVEARSPALPPPQAGFEERLARIEARLAELEQALEQRD